MATVLISFLFSPFFYGVEFFLASTLTTQVALSVATVVVSTATIFYCQRAFYQWYEDTSEFLVRIRNKVGLSDRHVKFTAKGQKDDENEGTGEDEPSLDGNNDEESATTRSKLRLGREDIISSSKKKQTKEKPTMPMDSWLQKQTVAMHRSHWVAKPGRIAPTTFIGFGRRGSADNTPTISSGKGPPWALGAETLSEQRTKGTLDRRQSSPSSLGTPSVQIGQTKTDTGPEGLTTNGGENKRSAGISYPNEVSGSASASSEAIEEATSPSSYEEVSRDLASNENSSSEDVAEAQDETPQERLIPTETEVKEALLVDGSSTVSSLHANVQHLPSESNSESDQPTQSQTSEERSSGQTDTDSLATDDIFSDSELDDSKRSDDVFLHDDADPATRKEPLADISGVGYRARSKDSSEGTHPDIVVCEAETTSHTSENTEAEPDSSISLSVEGGPIPRKDSFGLLPVLKGRVHHVKIETTSYTRPVTTISIEETKSESDSSEVAAILHEKEVDKSDPIDDGGGSSKKSVHLGPQKQDSLGVPPVVTGEIAFPGIHQKTCVTSTDDESKISLSKMSKADSLDVLPFIKLEERLPPYPIGTAKSKEQLEKLGHFQEVRVRLPPRMSFPRQGRPNSLDIPTLNISETCPPRRDSCGSRNYSLSSLNSLCNTPFANRGRKQGPSILKRSGSVDRTGPKKSVTFSPIVIPWGGSSEKGIEQSGDGFDLKRHSGSSSSPVRPKVIRYNSVDVPETMRRRQRTEFIRQLGMPAENSDEDQESWEQGRFVRFYRKSNQRDDKKGSKLDRKRSGMDEGPIKTDAIDSGEVSTDLSRGMGKSAKERFLEAGGARAVMSVLVTQDSSDRGIISSVSSSSEGKDSPPDDSGTSWAKTRFLMSGDGNMKASRLFVERVRGSMDMSETQSDHGSPSDTNEDTSSSSDQQFEENEEGGIRSTSAKSRFLWSCRENVPGSTTPPGSIPVDRLFALWEPIPLTLPEVPEGDEAEEDNTSKHQTKEIGKTEISLTQASSDRHDVTSKDDIDSPGSSGVHSMEPDEAVQERLLSLKEHTDSQTKHVPSDLSSSSSSSRSYRRQLKTAIVFDNGSQYMKVGLIDEKKPSIELPNVIARDIVESFNSRFIGLDAVKNCTLSAFEYPILGGLIQSWDDVESIWKHVFDAKLGLTPQEHPLLMTEIATVPKQQREKTMEILFETFNVPSLFFANQASLSLRATGKTTGLALSSGSGVTEVVPVYNGVTLSRAVTKLDLGGRSATKYLAHLVEKDTGQRLMTSPGAMEVLRELKEDQTGVNTIPDIAISPTVDDCEDVPWHCWLPDGSTVQVKRNLVQTCAEPLFQPALAGILHQPGMPNLVADCLDRCDQNMLSEFPSSLLLCGGNTYLGGFTERLQSELNTLGLGYITVEAPKGRDLLPWIGGALLASQLDNDNSWLESDEYAEHGASLVHKRCT